MEETMNLKNFHFDIGHYPGENFALLKLEICEKGDTIFTIFNLHIFKCVISFFYGEA